MNKQYLKVARLARELRRTSPLREYTLNKLTKQLVCDAIKRYA